MLADRPVDGVDEVAHELDRDEVEHQRRHDLADAAIGAEVARDECPRGAPGEAGQQRERDVDDRRQPEREQRDGSAERGTEIQLTLGADVEHPGAEADGNCEAGEQDRRHAHCGRRERGLRPERPTQHRAEGLERVGTDEEDDRGRDEEREEDRQEGRDEPVDGRASHLRRAVAPSDPDHATAPWIDASDRPIIISPMRPSSEGSGGTSPITSPLCITITRSLRASTSDSSVETNSTAAPRSR